MVLKGFLCLTTRVGLDFQTTREFNGIMENRVSDQDPFRLLASLRPKSNTVKQKSRAKNQASSFDLLTAI